MTDIYLPPHLTEDKLGLGDKQELFSRLLPHLMIKAFHFGFEIRGGDWFRDPRVHGEVGEKLGYGHRKSCHKLKLAVDLNLRFRAGAMVTDTEDHADLGAWWKLQHDLCRWGGDFKDSDGNHYSITHWGMS